MALRFALSLLLVAHLTDVERRYSQTEREALVEVWGCERFHIYRIHSLHRLQTIYSPKSKPPPRIEWWALRLQSYKLNIVHMAGKTNPADVAPSSATPAQPWKADGTSITLPPSPFPEPCPRQRLLMQRKMTQSCSNYNWEYLNGDKWPATPELLPLNRVRSELSVTKDLILCRRRLVIPAQLRRRTLQLAHETHQGIVCTKQLFREKIWWPGIDHDDVEQTVLTVCSKC